MTRTRLRGFTLIEIILAMLIFVVAIVAITEAISLQLRTERLAEDTSRAVMLSENLLEEIRYTGKLEEKDDSGTYEKSNAGFDWKYSIKRNGTGGLYDVTATVSWSDGRSKREQVLATRMASR